VIINNDIRQMKYRVWREQ